MDKATQKNRNSAAAGRMKHLREVKFQTSGFPSNGPIPSLSAARRMASDSRRAMGEVPHCIVRPQGA